MGKHKMFSGQSKDEKTKINFLYEFLCGLTYRPKGQVCNICTIDALFLKKSSRKNLPSCYDYNHGNQILSL